MDQTDGDTSVTITFTYFAFMSTFSDTRSKKDPLAQFKTAQNSSVSDVGTLWMQTVMLCNVKKASG